MAQWRHKMVLGYCNYRPERATLLRGFKSVLDEFIFVGNRVKSVLRNDVKDSCLAV